MKKRYLLFTAFLLCVFTQTAFAGNPDRQGEAGAYELLMNPWARSTGLHGMVTARIRGVEAMRINPAGLGFTRKTEIIAAHSFYLQGTSIGLNAFGIGQRLGKSGVIGVSIMAIDFGEMPVTTTDQPEGTGTTFSPSFFNIGISYAYVFDEKISVGATVRLVSESISNATASAVALDAGIQYVTGPKKNVKIGISLRNIGSKMRFSGEGLSFTGNAPDPDDEDYQLQISQKPAGYELPSQLNIGFAYDVYMGNADRNRLTFIGNFTSNSFGTDNFGAGVEYGFREMFMVRAGYRADPGYFNADDQKPVYTGLSGGVSLNVPVKKGSETRIGVDYSYRHSNPFNGSHNVGLRFNL